MQLSKPPYCPGIAHRHCIHSAMQVSSQKNAPRNDRFGIAGRVGAAALPATCGELVQGTLDGVRCLVSCPISHYSMARVTLHPERGWQVPHNASKAGAALQAALSFDKLRMPESGGTLELVSDLPRGRGYGSSTADIGATLFALGEALGQPLSAAIASQLAVNIEPSDSTLFPGLTLFDHRAGSFYAYLGPSPPLTVLVIDPGGQVDTLAFNRLDHRAALRRLAPIHQQAFALLRHGIQAEEWDALGAAATLSARAHQALLPNPWLERVLDLARQVRALGTCRAHSGTLLGLLLDPSHADVPSVTKFIQDRLPKPITVRAYAMVGGGPRDADE